MADQRDRKLSTQPEKCPECGSPIVNRRCVAANCDYVAEETDE